MANSGIHLYILTYVEDKPINILFALCHPDDEAIWCGGLLHALSGFSGVKAHVICLSGKDALSVREAEFLAAKEVANYTSGIVLGNPLRKADELLLNIQETLEIGLRALSLTKDSLNLIVTHSPYGDEHLHPHHVQTHFEIKKWAQKNKVSFSFMSVLPLPHLLHRNILTRTQRKKSFQIISMAKCLFRPCWSYLFFGWFSWQFKTRPKFYVQFLTDLETKKKMLGCYQSVDPKLFERGYAMYSNPCEAIYLQDERGLQVIHRLTSEMKIDDTGELFRSPELFTRVSRKVKKILGR